MKAPLVCTACTARELVMKEDSSEVKNRRVGIPAEGKTPLVPLYNRPKAQSEAAVG